MTPDPRGDGLIADVGVAVAPEGDSFAVHPLVTKFAKPGCVRKRPPGSPRRQTVVRVDPSPGLRRFVSVRDGARVCLRGVGAEFATGIPPLVAGRG